MRISPNASYLLERLHSLSGVIPVGAFLLEHLWTNSTALHGARAYNQASAALGGLPYVGLLELFLIAIPLLFHMAIGVVIVTAGQANVGRFRYASNFGYVLQRATGLILVVFIVWHVWLTRLSPAVRAGDTDLFALMAKQLASPGMLAFYVAGVVSAAWHFGNGLFGFSIHWGLATGRRAQRAVQRLGLAVAIVLSLVGVNSLLAFRHEAVRIFERTPRPPAISATATAPESARR